jgi:DNA-binding CsgD family transcriptional regulator
MLEKASARRVSTRAWSICETARKDTSTTPKPTTLGTERQPRPQPPTSRRRLLLGRERELASLSELVAKVRDGGGATIVVRGEAGVGKSVLLDHLVAAASGFQVVRIVGVEGEVDLPYAGLQQLCRSWVDTIDVLPEPQSHALSVAFGLRSGEAPDRYLVGLAALSLLSEVASEQPLLCVIDDAQWLDPATIQALAFVARRVGADSVGLVFACRELVVDLDGVPELQVGRLGPAAAGALLDSVLIGRLDGLVRERLLAEAHGNPLALLELPHSLTAAEMASGTLAGSQDSISGRIEESFARRLGMLPAEARSLVILAAAEPLGDSVLLHRAAAQLGLAEDAADAAEEAGLFEVRERASFRHPLVRSAAYRSATQPERRVAHAALADATNTVVDPDRKAWHRAQATPGPDEEVANELERTAARAKSRGGLAAAGAFLERSALLTPDADRRAERTLVAAEVMFEATGASAAVDRLLSTIDDAQLVERSKARAERLRATLSSVRDGHTRETALRLLAAADRVAPFDPAFANQARIEAQQVSFWLQDSELLAALERAYSEPATTQSGRIAELLLRGWAQIFNERGKGTGASLVHEGAIALCEKPELEESDFVLYAQTDIGTLSLWDFDTWEALTRRMLQAARACGSLPNVRHFLDRWVSVNVAAGEFGAAANAEADAIAEVIGGEHDPSRLPTDLAAWRLSEADALRMLDLAERETPLHSAWPCQRALVFNGTGRYESALDAAQQSCDLHPWGTFSWAWSELIEAAVRCRQPKRAAAVFERFPHRTRIARTDWGLGLQARSAALLTDDPVEAEPFYREAIERLDRARTRPDLARAHLLYGEWLRRENRRVDAREQLRVADDMLNDMGATLFVDRVHGELSATGETPRKRTDDARDNLTAHESQIAQLASEGLTNPEIGARLFLSPRTIEWHLSHIYPKLGISSRRELIAAQRTG